MTSLSFAVGHRTTHGFRLIIAVVTAAMIGFVFEVSRPVNSGAEAPPPVPPAAVQPVAVNS